jgi:hypothetical protein
MVSGMGTKPGRQRQMGLPMLLAVHWVLGPQGDGAQGSGFTTHRCPYQQGFPVDML